MAARDSEKEDPDTDILEMDYPLQNGENAFTKKNRKRHKHFGGGRVKSTIESSSFSLVTHIMDSTSVFGKLCWTLLLIGGIIAFSINFESLIKKFMKGPVLQTYKPGNAKFRWPDITLCNPTNPIPFWKKESLKSLWKEQMNKTTSYEFAISKKIIAPDPLSHLIAMSSLNLQDAYFNDINPMVFEHSIESLNSVNMDSLSETTLSDFTYARLIPHPFQIPCMTFDVAGANNSKQMLKLSQSVDIIRLYINMDFYSYNLFDYYGENRMVAVYISPKDHEISKSDHLYGVPGSSMYLKIGMKRVQRLTKRGTCVEKPFQMERYDTLLHNTRNYTGGYRDCQQFVKQRLTLEKCKCYNPTLPIYKSKQVPPRLCLNMSLFSPDSLADNYICMTQKVDQETKKRNVTECLQYLKPACDRNEYSVSYHSVTWPTDISPSRANYLKMLGSAMENSRNNPSVDFLRKNALFLTIRRNSEMADLVTEEYSYTFSQFISDFGGIIGLWLSLSLLSLFELIEIVMTSIGYCVVHKDGNRMSP